MNKHTSTEIIELLNKHKEELRERGVSHVSLFGSVARGEHSEVSDIDVALTIDPQADIDALDLMAIKIYLTELLGLPVDIVEEPIKNQALNEEIERDRAIAF